MSGLAWFCLGVAVFPLGLVVLVAIGAVSQGLERFWTR